MTVLSNFTDAELRKWASAYGVSTKGDSRDELLSALVRACSAFCSLSVGLC